MRWFGLGVAIWLRRVAGHSWVACTDYRVQNPTQSPQGLAETDPARLIYDDSKCFGYPRDWTEWNGECGFACDRGFNHQPGQGAACKTPRGDSGDYSTRYPAARYVAGQAVCVAHTVKNHVASPCTNAWIPDHGQHFYVAGPNLGSDPAMSVFKSRELPSYDGVHVVPSYDYKGFQNAPAFCDNKPSMDRATGTACFQLPSDMVSGRYTFLWYWAFNSDQDVYTTCWEADVVGGTSPTSRPTSAPTAKVTAPTPKPVLPITTPPAAAPVVVTTPGPASARRVCFDAVNLSID